MAEFRFGIEEEYFVVDCRSERVKTTADAEFFALANTRLDGRLTREVLQSQVEIATEPCDQPEEARAQLMLARQVLSEVGAHYGVGIVAAGTHPLALPTSQNVSHGRRYLELIDELGFIGLGSPLCGMHVHVEVPEDACRVGIMQKMIPFMPLFLALSTSSPFWSRTETGLLAFRPAINETFPRSGIPQEFTSAQEYQLYVDTLIKAGAIKDASYIWWGLRPSNAHPTLEMRVTDCCTDVHHAVAVASLYRALVRHFALSETAPPRNNQAALRRALVAENQWKAQRLGTEASFINVETGESESFVEALERVVAMVADDIADLRLAPEIARCREIADRGTSAHRQLDIFHSRREAGMGAAAALQGVCRWLRESTALGTFVTEMETAA